jgi:hypothetical protein
MRRRSRRRLVLAAIAAAACGWPATTRAQDAAAAGAMFDRGLAEMQAGRFETGCPALAESQRLDPRPGTLFTLAECNAKWGRVASALGHYEDYLTWFERMPSDQRAAQRGREKIAVQQRDAMRVAVPKLTLRFAAEPPPGTVVKRDGVELGAPSIGIALPIDPGEHVITIQSGKGAPREQRVTLAQGDLKELVLDSAPDGAKPPGPAPEAASPASSSMRTWGFVVGGVGVAGVIVGAVTGGMVLGKKSTMDAHCSGYACDAEGKRAADSAQGLSVVSTIGFVVGVVGLGTGTVLLLAAPSKAPQAGAHSTRVRPSLDWTPGGATAGVGGAW